MLAQRNFNRASSSAFSQEKILSSTPEAFFSFSARPLSPLFPFNVRSRLLLEHPLASQRERPLPLVRRAREEKPARRAGLGGEGAVGAVGAFPSHPWGVRTQSLSLFSRRENLPPPLLREGDGRARRVQRSLLLSTATLSEEATAAFPLLRGASARWIGVGTCNAAWSARSLRAEKSRNRTLNDTVISYRFLRPFLAAEGGTGGQGQGRRA